MTTPKAMTREELPPVPSQCAEHETLYGAWQLRAKESPLTDGAVFGRGDVGLLREMATWLELANGLIPPASPGELPTIWAIVRNDGLFHTASCSDFGLEAEAANKNSIEHIRISGYTWRVIAYPPPKPLDSPDLDCSECESLRNNLRGMQKEVESVKAMLDNAQKANRDWMAATDCVSPDKFTKPKPLDEGKVRETIENALLEVQMSLQMGSSRLSLKELAAYILAALKGAE